MGLENITRHIILDVVKNKYVSVQVKQYDINIREIIVKVTNNGKPYPIDNTIIPRIKCKKSDNTYVVNDCTVLDDGDVKIDITDQMTACSGICDCELALFDAETDKVLHTMNFIINVKEAVFSDDEVTSSNEFIALENALLKVDGLEEELEQAEEIRNQNEEERQSNEEDRISNENTRISNEEDRISAESIRVSNENTRISNEDERIASETTREINEINRIITEDTRVEAETERETNEEERKSNESERMSNEDIRQNNENIRISNEDIRKSNEEARISAENSRVEAETERVSSENIREENEAKRISAENIRIQNEKIRQSQENDRQTNTAAAIANAETATEKANDAANDLQAKLDDHHFVLTEDKDVAGGVPSLDASGQIPKSEVPIVSDLTATVTELNYCDGVTSNIQTQLNSKSATGHTHDDRYYTESETDVKLNEKLNTYLKGTANGLAELDSTGKVPSSQLPSFVDDVIEGYLYDGKFYEESTYSTEITGETGKIYVDLLTEKTYRWSGSAFVVISETLALGETSSTAYRGDRGKIAYDHSQSTHAPSNAQENIIETVKVNGTALTPSSKEVDITVPTKVSQLTNDSGYQNADDVSNAINAIEIGGRNLFLDTGKEIINNDYIINKYVFADEPLVDGETYTISMCVTPATNVSQYGVYSSNGRKLMTNLVVNGTDKQILSKTFTMSYLSGREPSVNPEYGNMWIYRFPDNGTVTENTIIHWIKVEKGNKPTDWTPAFEDLYGTFLYSSPFIIGTQTAVTGAWTGVAPFSELKDGQQITYWLPYDGSGNATLELTLSDGSTTGAIACYLSGNSRLTTRYYANTAIRFIYRENVTIGSNTYTGWWADADLNTDTYDRIRYQAAIKASEDIVAGNIIVGNSSGYHHLKTGGTFDISYPILYAAFAISSGSIRTTNYIIIPIEIATTQSLTLTAYKSLYIKGKLSGSTFTPISTAPITQDVPTTEDGYDYILLGTAYSTTGFYLLSNHTIFKFINGSFQEIGAGALDAFNNLEIGGRNLLKNSANMTFTLYGGATATTESNVSVSEWGATDAKRIYGTGGTSLVVALKDVTYPNKTLVGVSYVSSIYIKNNHSTNRIKISNNAGEAKWVEAGKSERVILKVNQSGKYLHFDLFVETLGDEFDVTYWHPKCEYGNKATDWSPAPEDIENKISDAVDNIQIGGRNILKDSENMYFNLYGGATATTQVNVSVDEWGATDAKRIYGTGGTSIFVAYKNNGGKYIKDVYYTTSIYVKNNHSTNRIVIQNNLDGSVYVEPGESKRVILVSKGNGSSAVQIKICTVNVGDEFDVTYWHSKCEIGNVASDWSPAPEDSVNMKEFTITGASGGFGMTIPIGYTKALLIMETHHPNEVKNGLPFTSVKYVDLTVNAGDTVIASQGTEFIHKYSVSISSAGSYGMLTVSITSYTSDIVTNGTVVFLK